MQVNAVSGREGKPPFRAGLRASAGAKNTIVVPWAIWCDFTQIRTVSI